MGLAADAGLTPTDQEYLDTHTHAHLDVFVDGTAVEVPAGIGIELSAEGVTETLTETARPPNTRLPPAARRASHPCTPIFRMA